VIISGEGSPGLGFGAFTPLDIYNLTPHELGHSLGLGHATNLESTDLMGYGWGPEGIQPVLSDCDVDALYYVWSWAINDTEPVPPAQATYDCSQS
jgi:hypothetical protein